MTRLNVNAMRFSSESVSPFLATVQNARINHSIEYLALYHMPDQFYVESWDSEPVLTPNNLRLTMAFSNLRYLDLHVAGHVALADDGLLELASAWPQLEHLAINNQSGWNSEETVFGGITPDGLVQLLQTCPLLYYIALVIDTRGYTIASDSALDRLPTTNLRSCLPTIFCIDVLDSMIEENSILAMAIWLADVVCPYTRFKFNYWDTCNYRLHSNSGGTACEYWEEVYRAASAILGRSKDDDLSWCEDHWPLCRGIV